MNSKTRRTSDPHRLLLILADKINFIICYTLKNIKKACKNNKFKISPPTRNEEFELPDGSYSVSDIQDYFEYILKTWRKD